MGDTVPQPGAQAEFPQKEAHAGTFLTSPTTDGHTNLDYSNLQARQQQAAGTQHAFASQLDMTQQRSGPFDMSGMANSLPQQPYRTAPYGQSPQRYNAASHVHSPVMAAQIPVSQYGAPPYYLPQGHMAQYYPTPLPSQQAVPNMSSRGDLSYYPAPVAMNQQSHPGPHYYYPAANHFPGQTGHSSHPQAHLMLGQYNQHTNLQQHADSATQNTHAGGQGQVSTSPLTAENESRQNNVVRGPPRKPRQSGHAIWIGNLPPQTELMDLVHHVCKETDGLESLFLISKSNCAFANFKDEQSCIAAQRKIHDSKFMTIKLVSRLRKNTVEGPAGVTAPTGPAASSPQLANLKDSTPASEIESGEDNPTTPAPSKLTPATSVAEFSAPSPAQRGGHSQQDRFFVLKSLTIQDLELSVRTNIWATQSHNEETLNGAFKTSDNVFLVFSANKSGEYFGYARMVSPINDDPAAAIEFAPKAQSTTDVDLPKAIPTEATEFAPPGRIIDDSARGTIFWEADLGDQTTDGVQDEEGSGGSGGSVGGDTDSIRNGQDGGRAGETKAWGKPFRVEWLSTTKLPFYRTRGLRNPWNSNREVKIARDGTELEPSVGRKLIGLFNRTQSPAVRMIPSLVSPVSTGGVHIPIPVPITTGHHPVMRPAY
ncbi:zinc finger CCCH domain-containing protein 45 [Podospora australis]|uniref:Zinc finger CCCH domain-containing protein 45 n=1 Tax=Podospora australis TaxID=1536484 RepID=A0AAN7AP88_9PEZI|nr:zinc finger CCCH domain-containing protein 45 [Podospora australis]